MVSTTAKASLESRPPAAPSPTALSSHSLLGSPRTECHLIWAARSGHMTPWPPPKTHALFCLDVKRKGLGLQKRTFPPPTGNAIFKASIQVLRSSWPSAQDFTSVASSYPTCGLSESSVQISTELESSAWPCPFPYHIPEHVLNQGQEQFNAGRPSPNTEASTNTQVLGML